MTLSMSCLHRRHFLDHLSEAIPMEITIPKFERSIDRIVRFYYQVYSALLASQQSLVWDFLKDLVLISYPDIIVETVVSVNER